MNRIAILAVLLLSGTGCDRAMFGLPRTAASAVSPNGRLTAYVRNHVSIDPPNQSLWLKGLDGRSIQLRTLGEDSQWCKQIVWSADSGTVAFLVEDLGGATLVVVNAIKGQVTDSNRLQGQRIGNLSLSADGSEASYQPWVGPAGGGVRDGGLKTKVRTRDSPGGAG